MKIASSLGGRQGSNVDSRIPRGVAPSAIASSRVGLASLRKRSSASRTATSLSPARPLSPMDGLMGAQSMPPRLPGEAR